MIYAYNKIINMKQIGADGAFLNGAFALGLGESLDRCIVFGVGLDDGFFSKMHGDLALGGAGDCLFELELVENTLAQQLFGRAAARELVVLLLEASPVQAELVEAVLVDVFKNGNSAAGDAAALFQAVDLAGAGGLLLAEHVVVVIWQAAGANVV